MLIIHQIQEVKKFFKEVLNEKCRVLTILKSEEKWKAVCEVIVDPEYTTRKGLGDIVEIYEVYLDEESEVIGYQLTETKRRAALDEDN